MPAAEEEFGSAIPYCHNDFVTAVKGVQGFVEEASQTKVTDSNLAFRSHHDVSRFEISVENPVRVEVQEAIEELKQDRFDG